MNPNEPRHFWQAADNWVLSGPTHRVMALRTVACGSLIRELPFGTRFGHVARGKDRIMNSIVYLVGLVVIVLFLLSFFGLR